MMQNELVAILVSARVAFASPEPLGHEAVAAGLGRALSLVADSGARAFEPLIRVEHHLFTEIGARGHAAKLTEELAIHG